MPFLSEDDVKSKSRIQIPGDPSQVISVRQNNPGNIKFANRPRQTDAGSRGFAIYDSLEEGYQDIKDLMRDVYIPAGHTISSMAEKYAPRFENDTDAWISNVSQLTGFKPNTPLSQIPLDNLAQAIAKVESSTVVSGGGQPQATGQFVSAEEVNKLTPQLTTPTQGMARPPSLESMVKRGAFESIPYAGMIGGGALGGALGLGGGPAAAPLGAVTGAGLGYSAAKRGQDFIRAAMGEQMPPPSEQALETGKDILRGGAYEATGQIGGALLGGLAGRSLKSAEEVARYQLAQDLAKEGVHLDPTTIVKPGPVTRFMAWVANKFEPGKTITQAYRKKALDALTQMRYNFVEETMGLPAVGSMRAGEAADKVSRVFERFREMSPDAKISVANTKSWLEGMKETDIPKKSVELYNLAKGRMATGEMTSSEIEAFNKSIWQGYKKLSIADRQFRNELLHHIYDDLPQSLAESLKFAKATTREIRQAKLIEGLLSRATSQNGQIFYPYKFYDLVKKSEDAIMRSLDKDQANVLFKFADQMKIAAGTEAKMRDIIFQKDMSDKALMYLAALGGGGAMFSQGGGASLLIPAGAQGWMAWSLMKPSGALRKLITSGLPDLSKSGALAIKTAMPEFGKKMPSLPKRESKSDVVGMDADKYGEMMP